MVGSGKPESDLDVLDSGWDDEQEGEQEGEQEDGVDALDAGREAPRRSRNAAAARRRKTIARAKRRRARAAAAAQKQEEKRKKKRTIEPPRASRPATSASTRPMARARDWQKMLIAFAVIVAIGAMTAFFLSRR